MIFQIEWQSSDPEVVQLKIVDSKSSQDDLESIQNALFDVWNMLGSLNKENGTLEDRLNRARKPSDG